MKIAVIGKGIGGLSCAYRLLGVADSITIFGSSASGERASNAAQGVICNKGLFESRSPLFEVKIKSTPWIKNWLQDFEKDSGRTVPKMFSGIFEVFNNHEDYQQHMKRIYRNQFRACFATQSYSGTPARFLSSKHYLYYPGDGWFDGPMLLEQMEAFLLEQRVNLRNDYVEKICHDQGRILLIGKSFVDSFDRVIVASGKNLGKILQDSGLQSPVILSVAGQILRMKQVTPQSNLVVVKGGHSLISHGGNYFLGSTSIKKSHLDDTDINKGAENLLFVAEDKFGLDLQTITGVTSCWGVRIRSRDRLPFWGNHPASGFRKKLWLVGGFYKNGLQFADFIARAVAKDFQGRIVSPLEEAFHINRLF